MFLVDEADSILNTVEGCGFVNPYTLRRTQADTSIGSLITGASTGLQRALRRRFSVLFGAAQKTSKKLHLQCI
jgi:hypothetical protein